MTKIHDYPPFVDRKHSVEVRVQARLHTLRSWKQADRVPVGQAVPKNLIAARIWDDPNIGILPIQSPNDFTTTHPVLGAAVSEIQSLLADLRKIAPTFDSRGQIRGRKQARNDLTFVVSQWHTERARNLDLINELREAESNKLLAERDNVALEKKLSELALLVSVLQGGPRIVRT